MNKYQDLDLIEAKIELVAGYIKEEKYIANLKLMFIPSWRNLRKKNKKQPTGAITRLTRPSIRWLRDFFHLEFARPRG